MTVSSSSYEVESSAVSPCPGRGVPTRLVLLVVAAITGPGCTGQISGNDPTGNDAREKPMPGDPEFELDLDPGDPGTLPADPADPDWKPVTACNPVLPQRVTRLSDRHLANALRDLLSLKIAPEIHTASGDAEDFIPNKAAAVGGAVAGKLTEIVEGLAEAATKAGQPAIACSGDENACARGFLNTFAARAFRRPLAAEESDRLLAVYSSGRINRGGHAGGIRLVIEAVLQAPSFLYLAELGMPTDAGQFQLSPFELATKVAFFLLDSVPDQPLWDAALAGRLDPQGLQAQVDRLMATETVKGNVERMFERLFRLDHIHGITKAASVNAWTPALATAMHEETSRFIADVLWQRDASLSTLLTSRSTAVNPALANLYGITHPGGDFAQVDLPALQRAGILTQPSLMTIEALPNESSVVHRGVFVVREMLCFHPPPPQADDLAQAEELQKETFTERERAVKRGNVVRCNGCHGFFDPFGVNFEHYDTLGRYRDSIDTPMGKVAVDSAWDAALYDVRGPVADAVALTQRLATSKAVSECMTRQFASYAVGQRLRDEEACTVGAIAQRFDKSGGNFLELVREIALWPGLRNRVEGGSP